MIDAKYLINQQGKRYVLYAGLLDLAHRLSEGRLCITSTVIQFPAPANDQTTVVLATAAMLDTAGRVVRSCTGVGDANPTNVGRMVAVHGIRMAECVPLRAEILTRNGWSTWDALRIGQEVLGYDLATDRCAWVPLLGVTCYPDGRDVVTLESRSFRASVTPEHSWVVRNRGRSMLVPTCALQPNDMIVLAAPAEGGPHPLTPRFAAILGWLATDGHIGHRGVSEVVASISQSKPAYVAELRQLLGADAGEHRSQRPPRLWPNGKVSATLPAHRFTLRAKFVRELLAAAGIKQWGELPTLVTRLTQPARAAMLEAMLKGDGHYRPNGWFGFGQKAKPGVMEAWELLAILEGYAVGAPLLDRRSGLPIRTLRRTRCSVVRQMRRAPGPAEPVWCPTTPLATWVMRLDGYITITGNTRAKARALRDLVNLAEAIDESDETLPAAHTPATPTAATESPAKEPVDELEMLRRRYARLVLKAKARGIDAPTLAPDAQPDDITKAGKEVQALLERMARVAAGANGAPAG